MYLKAVTIKLLSNFLNTPCTFIPPTVLLYIYRRTVGGSKGNLRVIENAKLRELVAKGPKYREPNRVNWKAIETMFVESIDLHAKNWSK